MRFKGLDLNLLHALDILIAERSVSRAALRLNLSQPAVSAILARLRDYFDDPLLVPQGRRMIPTSEAMALRSEIEPILGQLEQLITRSSQFDPASSSRTFRICASDYLVVVLFRKILPAIHVIAPGITFDILPPSEQAQVELERGELDVLFTPEEHCVSGHPTQLLFEETHVVAGWEKNSIFDGEITCEDFSASGHVAVRIGQVNRASFAESHLDELSIRRNIQITASSFTTIPDLLVGTNRLAVMHQKLAVVLAKSQPIVWQGLPFPFPSMRQMIQINSAREGDAGLSWLVSMIKRAEGEFGED